MNYQELKNAIIEVIRTNGNEEITGEVLQFVLLEMVSSLGKDFQFAGVATPQTEIIERDDKVAWVLGAGTYENFGIPFTVAVDEIAFVLYNGTYRVQKVKTGVIVDDTLTREGQNPVKGGAIYAEFEKLRAAGYLFAGVATPSLLPPANLTEKIFYLATQGGEYTNLDNITLTKGINIIRFDGTSWIGESLIAITDEVIDSNVSLITAAGVYNGLSGKVDKAEGMGLSQNSYTNTEKSKLGALPTAQELVQMLGGKQDVLTFDTTPTLNSQNPVTSDGIQRAIEAILILIPSAASALNQLADKSFVNSTVATASATFRGTYNLVSDLSLAVTATHAQIAAALAGAVSGADNNDYAFVQIPTSAGTPTEIRVTERYKFNGETWAYEYDLNNSGFTAAQWEAINSAITSALVAKLSALPMASELATQLAGKQNTLTFDNAPVSGSSNPVKSGGIYDAIAAITAVIPSAATSSNKLVDENALTTYVTGIIGALDASFDLTSADGHVTLKMTQVDGVITTLQILTSDIASEQALTTLSGQVSTNADDIAALQALYNALQQSAPEVIEPTDTWPVASPSDTVIYRVIDRVNTPPQYYSDYMFKADDLTTPVLMATYNNAIDAVPTPGSHNIVESSGVYEKINDVVLNLGAEIPADAFTQKNVPYYATNESILNDENRKRTNYIKVEVGDSFKYSSLSNSASIYAIAALDSSKNLIAEKSVPGNNAYISGTYTVESGVAYIQFCRVNGNNPPVITKTNPRYIDVNSVKTDIAKLNTEIAKVSAGYAVCATDADVADKTVTLDGFNLSNKARLIIRLDKINTADDVTLNINNTGAKPLYYNNARMSSTNKPDSTYTMLDVIYNGSSYYAGVYTYGMIYDGLNMNKTALALSARMGYILNQGARYLGMATPSTNPPALIASSFFLAVQPGVYTNFGGIEVRNLSILIYRTYVSEPTWVLHDLNVPFAQNIKTDGELAQKVANLLMSYHAYDTAHSESCLNLLHYSDLHGGNSELASIKGYADDFASSIDDIIQTGDLVTNYADEIPSTFSAMSGTLNVIGNHEVQGNGVTQKQVYDKFIAPYVSNWNVVQPTGAATNGLCYYYKDYSNKHVRLIVLDSDHLDSEQFTWFENILDDARQNSLHVICAIHRPPFPVTKNLSNPFCNVDYNYTDPTGVVEFANKVSSFITAGGIFVCWICGHIHDDLMGLGASYPNQLLISIACASYAPSIRFSSMQRNPSDYTAYCFNFFGVDTISKTLKLVRVGANYDRCLRKKDVLSWDYNTNQLIHV